MHSKDTARCRTCAAPLVVRPRDPARPAKFCSPACYHAGRTAGAVDRFWSRVDKNGPVPAHRPELGPCWVWTGQRSPKGYGVIWWHGRNERAHRVAWELVNGPVAEELWVLHACDNRACSNPLHLFLGDNLANNQDKAAKGRHVYGASHKLAKLTDSDAATIKAALADRSATRRTLAARFGVSRGVIDHIAAGTTWKHVQPA